MIKKTFSGYLIVSVCFVSLSLSCKKNNTAKSLNAPIYQISGSNIIYASSPVQLIGANAFHVFGAGGSDMNNWKMDAVREFIGNVKGTPLTGFAIKGLNGSYLYSLQTVVDSNRKNDRVSILCAFGWDGTRATVFTGTRPTQTKWFNEYKIILGQWGAYFKNQPDVWLEVWNEPYNYNRTDGYTDDVWLSDMNSLVAIIRNTGNNNIVLVPCAEQGQDESVLINKGTSFLNGKSNILFDIHAYEKWLLASNLSIGSRLSQLKQKNLPVIFGETAPINASTLMNPKSFLDSVYDQGISFCAWAWKYSDNDQDALLNIGGLPNNTNNNKWGSLYKAVAARNRNP